MIFWDSSAIVPLCVNEPSSATARSILADDPVAVVWWTTRTECMSALARQTREGGITLAGERQARETCCLNLRVHGLRFNSPTACALSQKGCLASTR